MYALTNGTLFTGAAELNDLAVWVVGDRIQALLPPHQLPADLPQVDLQSHYVAPGFIDLQLNGCGGVMFNDQIAPATLEVMHQTNLRSGTTSFLPTLITASDADMITALEVVAAYRQQHSSQVLGVHLEGPYLNPRRKGIHNGGYIRPPDWPMLKRVAQANSTGVRLITLAPEMVEPAAIQLLTEAGVVVAAGHTDATYEQAIAGFDAGITMATHLFNAMTPWQGRSPGMVGAVFNRAEIYAGIIADGHHVHFQSIALAQKIKGDRLLLVTDATPPAGTTLASFVIGGQEVFYQAGKCVSADGTLGGSALTMIEAVKNCVEHLSLPLAEALRMASLYPAAAIGYAQELGKIAPGYRANLVIFNRDWSVTGVVDQGQYQNLAPIQT